jgi:glycosyltransferase involved in cell wall biosynthesis
MRSLVLSRRANLVVSFLTPVNVATLIATRGTGVRVVVSERVYPPTDDTPVFWQGLRWLTYPWATCVVMQTSRGRAWLARRIPRARAAVIANPCVHPLPGGPPRIEPGHILQADRKIVLAVGRLVPQKGFDQLVRAFEGLAPRYPEWDLVIVGDGNQRPALVRQVDASGLNERVHLVGHAGNLGDWYARADLYVLSSRSEGFPNTLLEAMAHGVAPVSMACETGPSDILTHGRTGLLVDPEAGPSGLSEAMAALMDDTDARARLGHAARAATAGYAIGEIAKQWLALVGLAAR